jgi:hypothetical protein
MNDRRFSSTDSIVLRQVLHRAQAATVGGLLGAAVGWYLDALEADDHGDLEREAFAALTGAHSAALDAGRNVMWCVERFGGDHPLRDAAEVAARRARWLDSAHCALAAERRPRSGWRALLGRRRRPDHAALRGRARHYALRAMAFSEALERLRTLVD